MAHNARRKRERRARKTRKPATCRSKKRNFKFVRFLKRCFFIFICSSKQQGSNASLTEPEAPEKMSGINISVNPSTSVNKTGSTKVIWKAYQNSCTSTGKSKIDFTNLTKFAVQDHDSTENISSNCPLLKQTDSAVALNDKEQKQLEQVACIVMPVLTATPKVTCELNKSQKPCRRKNSNNICWCFQETPNFRHKERKLKGAEEKNVVIVNAAMTNNQQMIDNSEDEKQVGYNSDKGSSDISERIPTFINLSIRDLYAENPNFENSGCNHQKYKEAIQWWCDLSLNSCTDKVKHTNKISDKKVFGNRKIAAKEKNLIKVKNTLNTLEPYKSLLTIPSNLPNELTSLVYEASPVNCPPPKNRYYVPQIHQPPPRESYRISQIQTPPRSSSIGQYSSTRENAREYRQFHAGSVILPPHIDGRSTLITRRFPDMDFEISERKKHRSITPSQTLPVYRKSSKRTDGACPRNDVWRYNNPQIAVQTQRSSMAYQTNARPRHVSVQDPVEIKSPYGGRYSTAVNRQTLSRYSNRAVFQKYKKDLHSQRHAMLVNQIEYSRMQRELPSSGSSISPSSSFSEMSIYAEHDSDSVSFTSSEASDESCTDKNFYQECICFETVNNSPGRKLNVSRDVKPKNKNMELVKYNNNNNAFSNTSTSTNAGSSSTSFDYCTSSYMNGIFHSFLKHQQQKSPTRNIQTNRKTNIDILNILLYDFYTALPSVPLTNTDFLLYMFVVKIKVFKHHSAQCKEGQGNFDLNATQTGRTFKRIVISKSRNKTTKKTPVLQITDADANLDAVELKDACERSSIPVPVLHKNPVDAFATSNASKTEDPSDIISFSKHLNGKEASASKMTANDTSVPKPITNQKSSVTELPASDISVSKSITDKETPLSQMPENDNNFPKPLTNKAASVSVPVPATDISFPTYLTRKESPLLKTSVSNISFSKPVTNNEAPVSKLLARKNTLAEEQNIHDYDIDTLKYKKAAEEEVKEEQEEEEDEELEWYSQVAILRYKSKVSDFIENLVVEMMQSKTRSSIQKTKLALLLKYSIEKNLEPLLASQILQTSAFVNVSNKTQNVFDAVEAEGASEILLQIQRPKIRSFMANLLHDEIDELPESEYSLIVPFVKSAIKAILHKKIASKVIQKLDNKLSFDNQDNASRILNRIVKEQENSFIEPDAKATIPLLYIKSILEENLEKSEANKIYQKLSSRSISSWNSTNGSRQKFVPIPFVKQTVEATLQPELASHILKKVSGDVLFHSCSKELSRSTFLSFSFVKNFIMEIVDQKTASQILDKISLKTKEETGSSSKNTVPLPVVKEAIQEVLEPDVKKQSTSNQLHISSTSDFIANLIYDSILSLLIIHSNNERSLRMSEHLKDTSIPIASHKMDVVVQTVNVLEIIEEQSDADSVLPISQPLTTRNMGPSKNSRNKRSTHKVEGEDFLDNKKSDLRKDKEYERLFKNYSDNICCCFLELPDGHGTKIRRVNKKHEVIVNTEMTSNTQSIQDYALSDISERIPTCINMSVQHLCARDANFESNKCTNQKCKQAVQWWCDLGVNTLSEKNQRTIQMKERNSKKVFSNNNGKLAKLKNVITKLESYKSLLTIPGNTKIFPFDLPNKLMPFSFTINPVVSNCPAPRNFYYVPQNRYEQIAPPSPGESYRTIPIQAYPPRSSLKQPTYPRTNVQEHQPSPKGSTRRIYWENMDSQKRYLCTQRPFPNKDSEIPERTKPRSITHNQPPPEYRSSSTRPPSYRQRPVYTGKACPRYDARRYHPQKIVVQVRKPSVSYDSGARLRHISIQDPLKVKRPYGREHSSVANRQEPIKNISITVPREQPVQRQRQPQAMLVNQIKYNHIRQGLSASSQSCSSLSTSSFLTECSEEHDFLKFSSSDDNSQKSASNQKPIMYYHTGALPIHGPRQVSVQVSSPQIGKYVTRKTTKKRSSRQPYMMLVNQIEYNRMCQKLPYSLPSVSCYNSNKSVKLNLKKSSSFDDKTPEFTSDQDSSTDENLSQACICFETEKISPQPKLVVSHVKHGNNRMEIQKYKNTFSNYFTSTDIGGSRAPSFYTDGTFHSITNCNMPKMQQWSSLLNTQSLHSNPKTNTDILNILLYDSCALPDSVPLIPLKNKDFLLYYMFVTTIKVFKHRSTQCRDGQSDLNQNTSDVCRTFTKIVIAKPTNASTTGTPLPQITYAKANNTSVEPKARKCECKKSKIPVRNNLKKPKDASSTLVPNEIKNESHSSIIRIPKVLSSKVASVSKIPARENSTGSDDQNAPVVKSPLQINTEFDYEPELDSIDIFEFKEEEEKETEWNSQVALLKCKSKVAAFIISLVAEVMQPKSVLHSQRSSKQQAKLALLVKHFIEKVLEPTLASEILQSVDLDSVANEEDNILDAVETEGATQILLQIKRQQIKAFMTGLLQDEVAQLSQSQHSLIVPFIKSLLEAILQEQIALNVEEKLSTDNLCRQTSISLTYVQKLIAEELNHDIASIVLKTLSKHSATNVSEDLYKNKFVPLVCLNEVLQQKLEPGIASEIFYKMKLEHIQSSHNVYEQKSLSLTYIKGVLEEVLKPKVASKILKGLSKRSSLDHSGDCNKNNSIPFATVKEVVNQTVKPEEATQIFKKLAPEDCEDHKFVSLLSVKDVLETKVGSDVALEIVQALSARSVTLRTVPIEFVKEVVEQNSNPENASKVINRINEEQTFSDIKLDTNAEVSLSAIKKILEENLSKTEANKVYRKLTAKNVSSWGFKKISKQQSVSVQFVKQTLETSLQPKVASKIIRKVALCVASRRHSEELSRSMSLPLPFVKNFIMEIVDPETASQIFNKISFKTKQNPKDTVPLPVVKEAIQEVLEPDAKKQSTMSHQLYKSSTSDFIADLIKEFIFLLCATTHATNVSPDQLATLTLPSNAEESDQENKKMLNYSNESVIYEMLSSRIRPFTSQKTDIVIPLQRANVLEVVEAQSDIGSVPPVLEPLGPRNVKIWVTSKKESDGDMHEEESEKFTDLDNPEEYDQRASEHYENMLNELITKDRYFYTITGIKKDRTAEITEKVYKEPKNVEKFYKEPFDYSGCVSKGNYEPCFDCIDLSEYGLEHNKPSTPTDIVESGSNLLHISSADNVEKCFQGIDYNGIINPEFYEVYKQKPQRNAQYCFHELENENLKSKSKESKDLILNKFSEDFAFSDYKYFGPEISKYSILSEQTNTDFEPVTNNINSYPFLTKESMAKETEAVSSKKISEPNDFIDILKPQMADDKKADYCDSECAWNEEAQGTYSKVKDISPRKETSTACLVRYTYTVSSQTDLDGKPKPVENAEFLASCCQPLLLQLICDCDCPETKNEPQIVNICCCSCPCDKNKKPLNSKALVVEPQHAHDVLKEPANLSTETQTSSTALIKSAETQTDNISVADVLETTNYEIILHIRERKDLSNAGMQTYAALVPVIATRGTMTTVKPMQSKCTCPVCNTKNCHFCKNDNDAEYTHTCSCSPCYTYNNLHYKSSSSNSSPYENTVPPFKYETHVHVSANPQKIVCQGPSPYLVPQIRCIPNSLCSTNKVSNTFQNAPVRPEQNNSIPPEVLKNTLTTTPEEYINAPTNSLAKRQSSSKTKHPYTKQSSNDVSGGTSKHYPSSMLLSANAQPTCDKRNVSECNLRSRPFEFNCLHQQDFRCNAQPRCFNLGNFKNNEKNFRFDFSVVRSTVSGRRLSDTGRNEQPFHFGAVPQQSRSQIRQNSSFGFKNEKYEDSVQNRNVRFYQCSRRLVTGKEQQEKICSNLCSLQSEASRQSLEMGSVNFEVAPKGHIDFVARPIPESNGLSEERRKQFEKIAEAYNRRIDKSSGGSPDTETSGNIQKTTNGSARGDFTQCSKIPVKEHPVFENSSTRLLLPPLVEDPRESTMKYRSGECATNELASFSKASNASGKNYMISSKMEYSQPSKESPKQKLSQNVNMFNPGTKECSCSGKSTTSKSTTNRNFVKPGTSTAEQDVKCEHVSIKNMYLLSKAFESPLPQKPGTTSEAGKKGAGKQKIIPFRPKHKYSAFSKTDCSSPASTETETSKRHSNI